MLGILIIPVISGHYRYVCSRHDLLRLALASHRSYGLGRRTDELYSVLNALLSEEGVFGEEAEPRMQCFAVGILGDFEDLLLVEVGLG
jgi:hypothetical protein